MTITHKIKKEIEQCGGIQEGMRYLARRYDRWLTSGCCLNWHYCRCPVSIQPSHAEHYSYYKLKEWSDL